jgi:predicted nuclease of predicted toxin-antitoxin system
MAVGLYMDVHVRRAVTVGLRLRGADVLTAQEDGAANFDDPRLLDRASELGRVLFTHDDDLLREAARRQETGEIFAGVIYAHQLNLTVGQCIEDLELITHATESVEWINQVTYLPLK